MPTITLDPVYTLAACNGCASAWAIAPLGPELWGLWSAHSVSGDAPFVIAGGIVCPACGGNVTVTADLAVQSQAGGWLNISLSDPVFADKIEAN